MKQSPHLTDGKKRTKLVSTARSYQKKLRYKFGKKRIPAGQGDCSAFTKHVVYTALKIKLGNSTLEQVKVGRRIPINQAKPGDLIFFKNMYRKGVSHVGIVTKPGSFIGLQITGCYETTYRTGFWAEKLMEIRRIIE